MPKAKKAVKPEQADLNADEEAKLAKLEEEANLKAKADAEAKAKASEAPEEAKGEDVTPAPVSAPEETKPSKPEEKPEAKSPEEEEGEPTDEEILAHLKAKGQKRFKTLVKERGDLADENRKLKVMLEQKISAPEVPPVKPPFAKEKPVSEGLPWEETPAPTVPREVTQEEYQADVEKAATDKVQSEVQRWMAQYQRAQQVQADVETVEANYSELSPGKRDAVTGAITEANPDYDEALAKSIAEWYKGLIKSNPDLRLLGFVKQIMDLRKEGEEKAKSKVTAKVAKQAATQAITPTGTPAEGKEDLTQMIKKAETEEELDKLEKLLPHA